MANPEKSSRSQAIQLTLEGDWGIPPVRPEDFIDQRALNSTLGDLTGSDALSSPAIEQSLTEQQRRVRRPTMVETLAGLWRDNRGLDFLDIGAIRDADVAVLLKEAWDKLKILQVNQQVYSDSSSDGRIYGTTYKRSTKKGGGFYVEKGQDYGILSVVRDMPLKSCTT